MISISGSKCWRRSAYSRVMGSPLASVAANIIPLLAFELCGIASGFIPFCSSPAIHSQRASSRLAST